MRLRTNSEWFAVQRRIIQQFDASIEGVHVDVHNNLREIPFCFHLR